MKRFKPGHYISPLTVCLFFLLFLLLGHPAYNSDDDIYFAYALSGGYGLPSTHLLHYSFGWHPVLSWPVMHLFQLFPQVNWYTIFLVTLNLVSCIHLLFQLQILLNTKKALMVFFLFFLFIEARLLLSLNFSGTSLVLSVSGLSGFLIYYQGLYKSKLFPRRLLAAALLVVAGGCLRLHVTAFCTLLTLISGPFLMPFSHYRAMIRALFFPGLALLLLAAGQQAFYQQTIPNWKEEESLRRSVFKLYNHPANALTPTDSNALVTQSFIKTSFLYDASFAGQKDLEAYAHQAATQKTDHGRPVVDGLYWAFMESRVYLFLWIALLLGFFFTNSTKASRKWLWQCLLLFFILCYFYTYLKITEAIFLALFSSIFLSAVYAGRALQVNSGLKKGVFYALLFFSCAWMVKRLASMDARNRYSIEKSRMAIRKLNAHKNLLFISTDNQFPINISAWDAPSDYPLANFLNKELVLTNTHQEVLQRYGITSLASVLPLRSDIMLVGAELPLLKEYYKYKRNREVEIKKKVQWDRMGVYQVRAKEKQ